MNTFENIEMTPEMRASILEKMNHILNEECPYSGEYTEMARYTWPERWAKLEEFFAGVKISDKNNISQTSKNSDCENNIPATIFAPFSTIVINNLVQRTKK